MIYVKSRKTFVLQPQEPLQNLLSANKVVRPMFHLNSSIDGVSLRVCRMVTLLNSC